MRIFGKTLSEYVRFTCIGLALIAGVTLLRLVLSLAGVPNASTRWLSGTVVTLICVLVYSARVHTTGFGSYKQVLPVVALQAATLHAIVIAAILLAMATGHDNIFTAPEYSGGGDGKTWGHALAHLGLGVVVGSLLLWGVGCLVLLVTKKVSPRPGTERAAA